MVKVKSMIKVNDYDGLPKLSDFKLTEEDVSFQLEDGELLTKPLMMSVDPYLRVYPIPAGFAVPAFQIAEVVESKNSDYPKGSVVYQLQKWQTMSKSTSKDIWARVDNLKPSIGHDAFMGVAGMPGLSGYFGLLEICKPKPGDTVMVSTCAGAVGSTVGQIAKIKGCRVIGSCGSDEKVEFAKSIGYDAAFNYKTEKSWPDALKRLAPDGIDCYYDNVGGQLSTDVLENMNNGGRVAVCGAICGYNSSEPVKATMVQYAMISKQLKMEGFNVIQFMHKKEDALKDLTKWVSEGKIKVRVTTTHGFENIPKAFIGMLSGKNIGKAVVKVDSEAGKGSAF